MADSLQSTLQCLHSLLSSKSPHRGAQAAQYASDLYTFCVESVSDSELAHCSAVIFHRDSGVLCFLSKSSTLDEFASCQEQLLNLLESYVKAHKKNVLQYAVEIKEVCNSLFSRSKSSKVKNAVFPPLIAVLELVSQTSMVKDLNVPKLAEKFYQASLQSTKHVSTVRGHMFELLGTISELYPEDMAKFADRLAEVILRTLKNEMKSKKKPDMPVIAGCLKAMNSFLVNFSPEASLHSQDIYKFARMAMDPEINHTRYEVPRAALSLMTNQTGLFKEYFAKDYEEMYRYIRSWTSHNNRDNRNLALKALDTFLKQVSQYVVENAGRDRSANLKIFKHFVLKFREVISDKSSGHLDLALAVNGYGYFAAPCKIFMKPEDLRYMFGEMVQRTEQLFFSVVEVTDNRFTNLPSFLTALASIVREMDDISESLVLSLEKLLVLLLELLPFLPAVTSVSSHYVVFNLILAVATSSRATLKTFLSHVVLQGVIISCSHEPVVDTGEVGAAVHLDKDTATTDALGRKKASYLDYVELWKAIMDPGKLKDSGLHPVDPAVRKTLHQMIYDEFVEAVFKISHRLDLSIRPSSELLKESPPPETDGKKESPPATMPLEGSGVHQLAVLKDHIIFINLVDLCRSVLLKVQACMFEEWVFQYGREMIVFSSHHPTVSGFYKLLAICFKLCKDTDYFKGVDESDSEPSSSALSMDASEVVAMETDAMDRKVCFALFRKFTKEVLVVMRQYKDDLLASCLQLLLALPKQIVKLEIEALVPVLQSTFKLGLSYLPLAHAGLDALEAWNKQLPPALLHKHFSDVLPYLDDYLRTINAESSGQEASKNLEALSQSHSSRGRKIPSKIVAKWKEGVESAETPLGVLRRRIMFFLGSLGGQNNGCLVKQGPAATEAAKVMAWDSKNRLEFALPFQDMKPSMFLDSFLPRVCELATTSSVRQTKIAACELLHALVLFIIGRSAQPALQKKSPMTNLYKKLFPYLLQLGCDVERVAEQLFCPLVFQMIHWFTRNTQYESPDTIALLDAILEGVIHPTDSALRDFSASCIREFLEWSIKQTTQKQQEKSPINTKSLLKRLYSLAEHPSAAKRMGAALAINSIYTVFREEESLVDVFVIEMLVTMINSLRLAHSDSEFTGAEEQTSNAVDHIARIICVKASILSKPNSRRRVPKALKSADINNLVNWLLAQCGSSETACRVKCRQLFCMFGPHVPKIISERVWIKKTVESEGGGYFVSRFEKDKGRGGIAKSPVLLGACFSLSESIMWLEGVMAAVDCYIWVFAEDLLTPEELFLAQPKKSEKPSCLFQSLEFFVGKLSLVGIEGALKCFEGPTEPPVLSPRDEEMYTKAKCDVIMYLIQFVGVLVDHCYDNHTSCVPSSFWSEGLFQLLALSCTQPSLLGFRPSDIKTTEKLSKTILTTLRSIGKSVGERTKSSLLAALVAEMKPGDCCDLIGQLPVCLHGGLGSSLTDQVQLDNLVSSHLTVLRAGLFDALLMKLNYSAADVIPKLMASVTDTLKPLVSGASSSTVHSGQLENQLSPSSEHSLKLLLQLTLEMNVDLNILLDCILDVDADVPGLGLFLFQSFCALFNEHFSLCHERFLARLLYYSSERPLHVSVVLGSFLEHVHKEKALRRKYGGGICSFLLSHWAKLESWWTGSSSVDMKLAAITVLKRMFTIDQELLSRHASDSVWLEPVFSMYLNLLGDSQCSLTFKGLVLEILHHFASLSLAYIPRLMDKINLMISTQFPLKSTEFLPGSPQYNEYISCLEKLLHGLEQSGSLSLLEVVLGVMCREPSHVHEEYIQSSLLRFIDKLRSGKEGKAAIDVAYQVLMDNSKHSPEARKAAGERMCLPLLRVCGLETLREFFLDHIQEVMAVLESNFERSNVESQLTSKLCCFQMMEVLYSRLPKGPLTNPQSDIIKMYCRGAPKTGKELTQAITKASHSAKCEDLHGDRTHYSLRLQYHCAAYNALVAVITCTQDKIQFYHGFLFKEDLNKGQLLWDNIVDLEAAYQFDIELERPLLHKTQLTAIRDDVRAGSSSRETSPMDSSSPYAPRYLSSQYLADSSLCMDVSQYDFSTGTKSYPKIHIAPTQQESSYLVNEEQLEMDVLNQHECMLPLMKLLDHMQHNNINPPLPIDSGVPVEMPSWMAALHKSFNDGRTHRNVRLFLARLIVNRPKIFQPYAKFWLVPLVQLVIGGDNGGNGLHYFVVDIMVTILSWSTTAILEDTYLANRLLKYLMLHCPHDNKSVLRNNLEIIKTLVEAWKANLQPSYKVIFDHFGQSSHDSKSSRTGVQLLGIMLANGMPPYDSATAETVDEKRYYRDLVSLMGHKYKEVFAAVAEVLGLALAYMEDNLHGNLDKVKELVIQRLMDLAADRQEDKFLTCLYKIQLNYDKITERFVEKLLFLLPNFHGLFRSQCLEVLVSQADIHLQLYQGLKDKGFHDMLTHRDEPTQLAALKLVQRMVQHQTLKQEYLMAVMPLVFKFGDHSSEACRTVMYETLITAYNNIIEADGESPSEEDVKSLMKDIRDQLLQGLSDESETIRLKMFSFWNEESRLSSETLPRLTQLLPVLYSERSEPHFLHHSTNLLLELTSRSPDFNRSIFDSPLSECKFEDYTGIDLSWHQRHLQMTPLFAATQASQTVEQSLATSGASVQLRATQQALAFTPTQEGYNWMAPSMQSVDTSSYGSGSVDPSKQASASSSSFLFKVPTSRPRRPVGPDFGKERLRPDDSTMSTDSQEEQRNEILRLKRRFLKDRSITSSYYAKYGARKKAMREERRKEQKAARDSKVVMYRKYRKGELPDIQIKHAELIRPFQALAQHDSTLARMLFTFLYEAIYKQVGSILTDKEAEDTTAAIKEGLNTIIDSSKLYHAPFIGSLQEICYRDKQLQLKPASISKASLMSMQEPIGIMLLEKQLLCNSGDDQQDGPSSKRARTSHQPLPETTATWVELSKLYKSLGDFDAVRGIFSSQVGTKPITQGALEAEERGDYMDALHKYKEALKCSSWRGGEPTSVEEDLWEDSLLACYSHLTEWEELEKAVVNNVVSAEDGEALDKFWSNSYEEHYLPHFVHSKVKLACSGKDDPAFSKFLEDALKDSDESKRRALELEHSVDLALYSVLKGNHDRARYYVSKSLEFFLNDWSSMDKLLVNNRAARLRVLQPLTELQEYLEFVSESKHFANIGEVEKLLRKWCGRFPDPKKDSVEVWDDIVTSRCMMMKRLMDLYSIHVSAPPPPSLDDSQEGVAPVNQLKSLQDLFSREFTQLYLKLADSARQQTNYAVAYKYLQLTESAIAEHFPNDLELQLDWMHSVAHIRSQEAMQDPSPPKIRSMITLVERLDGYADEDILTTNHVLAQRHHQLEGTSYNILAKAFSEEGGLLMEVLSDETKKNLHYAIKKDPSAALTPDEVAHKLQFRAMSCLKAAVKSGTAEHKRSGVKEGMVEALLEMASFCDRELRLKEDEDIDSSMDVAQYPSVVVGYNLKAMQYGSGAAAQQVPRILQVLEIYPEAKDQFVKKSVSVPCWMFISWLSQMIPLLDKPEGSAIQNILLSIASSYPQALAYPLKISSNDYKFDTSREGREQEQFVKRLKQKIENKLLDCFVAALELLCSPELVVKDFLDNDLRPVMEETIGKRSKAKLERVWKQLSDQLQDWDTGSSSSLYDDMTSIEIGHFQKKFAKDHGKLIEQKFGKKGSKLASMSLRDFRSAMEDLVSKMKPNLQKTTGQRLLKDYSPWLSSFHAYQYTETIEIPGQYGGKSKPLPEYHTKISGLDEKVLVMSSIRKPKRITLRGDDEKDYMFLVKGGEDLRLDQRIEQLYCVMNDILREDAACSQRGLYLRTYQVIPMTPRVGLIEWMQHTKPLKDFVKDALRDDEVDTYSKALKYQNDWLHKHNDNYKVMYRNARYTEVNEQYQKKVACVPPDILRRAFLQLSSCPEAFLTLRTHCIRTLATLSMCQYILGIGDRHLSNFMVDLDSGGMIGIDFGHNFGTATQFLPFPELMPFRLTPQFTNLLLPHVESGRSSSGQLRSCMVHTLRALRNSHQILLNMMDIFVKEPALDWKMFARKQAKTQRKTDQTALEGGGTWYPREKIRAARKKLQGYNPAHVMLTDLKNGHEKSQEFPALKSILMGDKRVNKRAQVGERCISVEEQVACLVDHAADPNILGRTWAGWEPWV